jgi:hypothetical protein
VVQHLAKLACIPTETGAAISMERVADPDVEPRGLGTRAFADLSLSSSAPSFLGGAQDLPPCKPSACLFTLTPFLRFLSIGNLLRLLADGNSHEGLGHP